MGSYSQAKAGGSQQGEHDAPEAEVKSEIPDDDEDGLCDYAKASIKAMQARKAKKAAATTALKRPADSVKRGTPSKVEQLAKAEGGAAKVEKKPKAEQKINTEAIEVSKKTSRMQCQH